VIVPTLHTWITGEVATAANLNNNTVTAVGFLLAPPLAVLRQTVAQSIASGVTPIAVNMDTEDIDRDAAHSVISNTSRYTGQTPGYYDIDGAAGVAGNATGRRSTHVLVNGTTVTGAAGQATTATASHAAISTRVFLNGTTDYAEIGVIQNSGGALNTDVAFGNPRMSALWVSS
jgi:hypothetical protein